jgi:hypothetical protein
MSPHKKVWRAARRCDEVTGNWFRVCTLCNKEMPETEAYFYARPDKKYPWGSQCRKCWSKKTNEQHKSKDYKEKRIGWYKATVEQRRSYSFKYRQTLKGKIGVIKNSIGRNGLIISDDDCMKILPLIHTKCQICGRSSNPKKKLCIDHNHRTGEIRGVLCDRCNRSIGLLNDHPAHMLKAIYYLEKTQPVDSYCI